MEDPTARALDLLSLLQTHRFWTGNELCERLDVSPRTLRRDIDRLRSLGYPVDATTGPAGGYRLAAGAHLPPLLLDDEEAVAIAVGLRAAAGASVAGFEETSVRALAKLDQVLPDRLRRRVAAVHANVVPLRWGAEGPTVDADDLAVLSIACRDHEQLRFEYQRADGQSARRLVEPHQLVSAGRRWYLVAWDVRRDDWRTFRVDRMSEPSLAGVRCSPRTLPAEDAAAFVAQSLGSLRSQHEVEVEVGAPADLTAARSRWMGAQITADHGDSCRVRLVGEAVEWLAVGVATLAMDAEVRILDPTDELLARVADIGRRLPVPASG